MSWWDVPGKVCVVAYQALAAATIEASYMNWADPGTLDAVVGVAPVFTRETGWSFDGVTQYLTTGVIPTATYSMSIRFSALGNLSTTVCGATEAVANAYFFIAPTVDNKVEYGHGVNAQQAPGMIAGVLGITPLMGYRNGVSDKAIGAFTGTGRAVYIGAWNSGGMAGNFAQVVIQALVIHSEALTAGEMAVLHANMAAIRALAYPAVSDGLMQQWVRMQVPSRL